METLMQSMDSLGRAPEFQDAVVQRAMSLYRQGQFNSADLLFATLAGERRLTPLVHHMRGLIARQLGFKAEARQQIREAIEADPTVAQAHANMGMLLFEEGQLPEALAAFAAALALESRSPGSHYGLAQVLAGMGCVDLAMAAQRDAIALEPDFVMAEIHLCALLTRVGRGGEALERLRAALKRHPDQPDLGTALVSCLLTTGDWSAAWTALERCWDDPRRTDPALAGYPRWRGEDLAGRTVLLQAERSDADTLMLCRYARLVKERAGRVIFRAPSSLAPLLQTVQGIDEVVVAGRPLPAFDLIAPALSLPAIFRSQPETVPAAVPYLRADIARIEAWRERLGPNALLTVGVSRTGGSGEEGPTAAGGRVDLSMLRPLFENPMVRFVDVDGEGGDSRLLAPDVERGDGALADKAGLIAALDLLITVDGTLAHLAGALGTPSWILLSAAADWRWLRDRADSPWYPRTRLFRQQTSGHWGDVIDRVGEVLRAVAAGEEPPAGSVTSPPPPLPPFPVLLDALFAEGARHQQAGDKARARQFYRRALAADPDHVNSLCNLAALELSQGHAGEARRLLQRAIGLAPASAPAGRVLADLSRTTGSNASAAALYRRVLGLSPRDAAAHAGLAMTLRGLQDYQGAMAHFQTAVEIDRGQSAEFFLELGQTLVALDRLDSAMVSLLHALDLDPDLLPGHCVLGQVHLKAGRYEAAAASFRHALAIDPHCAQARDGLDRAGVAAGGLS